MDKLEKLNKFLNSLDHNWIITTNSVIKPYYILKSSLGEISFYLNPETKIVDGRVYVKLITSEANVIKANKQSYRPILERVANEITKILGE